MIKNDGAEAWVEVSPEALAGRLESGDPPVMVDVRTLPEVAAYHIPGILWIPLNELPARLSEMDPEQETVLLCEHGVRSVAACQFLQQNGFGKLGNMTGGMSGWNGPVQSGLPAPPKE
jgi:rhodanese-related sulfurtransferase